MCAAVCTADSGQRVHVGKVSMDHEQTTNTTHQLIDQTQKFVQNNIIVYIHVCHVHVYTLYMYIHLSTVPVLKAGHASVLCFLFCFVIFFVCLG